MAVEQNNSIGVASNNSPMDMLFPQLMIVALVTTLINKTSSTGGQFNFYNILYIFILFQIINFTSKIFTFFSSYLINRFTNINKKENNSKENNSNKDKNKNIELDTKDKASSIIVTINLAETDNIMGLALMDYITNHNNTKHVSFNKQSFVLNQKDIIEIADDINIILLDSSNIIDSDSTSCDIKKHCTIASASSSASAQPVIQMIELFSYVLPIHKLRSFIDKVTYDYKLKIQNKLGTDIYYFNQLPQFAVKTLDGSKDYSKMPNNCLFSMKKFYTNRSFNNLFGPEIDIIRKRVEFFIKNKKWYDKKGIPYTLGLLLSGQSGAGKTSTIKCLVNETRRHIININLNNDITKNQLENLFFNEVINTFNPSTGKNEQFCIPLEQRVYVLEDIDCQSDLVMERSLKQNVNNNDFIIPKDNIINNSANTNDNIVTNANNNSTNNNSTNNNSTNNNSTNNNKNNNSQKIDLSFLLNLLDGILETPGRIVILTSNYPKVLDHALIRPGRIDIIADFKKCTHETLIEMIEYFYDIELGDEDIEKIHSLQEYIISPAEMGKIMFENFEDYQYAINKIIKLNEEKINEQKLQQQNNLSFHDLISNNSFIQ